ncbi:MAG: hypothetical protein ACYDA1_04295 [Vulcanimicrobiaceae bacterium]
MVSRIVSVVVIIAAIVVIIAGAIQNRVIEHQREVIRRTTPDGMAPHSGIRNIDRFADDPVVVPCATMNAAPLHNPMLRLFLVGAGQNQISDHDLFSLSVPSAVVVVPKGRDAKNVVRRAQQYGSPVFIQLDGALGSRQIQQDRARFGGIAGYAGRDASAARMALAGSGLSFFDERGDAAAASYRAAGIRYFGRAVTADNDEGNGYISFMLKRAVTMSRSCGPLNVLMRANHNSLKAAAKALNETPIGDAFTLPQ